MQKYLRSCCSYVNIYVLDISFWAMLCYAIKNCQTANVAPGFTFVFNIIFLGNANRQSVINSTLYDYQFKIYNLQFKK